MTKVWGAEPPESDALRSHIYQIRKQLDKPFTYDMLATLHGVGFAFKVENC
jgi:DNA-binding response OmpR family regulator